MAKTPMVVGLNKKTFGAVFACTISCQCVLPLRTAIEIYFNTQIIALIKTIYKPNITRLNLLNKCTRKKKYAMCGINQGRNPYKSKV